MLLIDTQRKKATAKPPVHRQDHQIHSLAVGHLGMDRKAVDHDVWFHFNRYPVFTGLALALPPE